MHHFLKENNQFKHHSLFINEIVSPLAYILFFLFLLIQVFGSVAYSDDLFPHRKTYPNVKTISTEELKEAYEDSIIVDARSSLEFLVIHIKGAINATLSSPSYITKIKQLRKKHPEKRIVVYCNGFTCSVSYRAVLKAMDNNIENIVAYDSGVSTWVKEHPEKTTLMNESPADLNKLISKNEFNRAVLTFHELQKRSLEKNTIVLDIREKHQRNKELKLNGIKHIRLNSLLLKLASQAYKGKTLLFIDDAGKQLQWLQYYLESNGHKSYYFLKGGAISLSSDSFAN